MVLILLHPVSKKKELMSWRNRNAVFFAITLECQRVAAWVENHFFRRWLLELLEKVLSGLFLVFRNRFYNIFSSEVLKILPEYFTIFWILKICFKYDFWFILLLPGTREFGVKEMSNASKDEWWKIKLEDGKNLWNRANCMR